MHNLEYALISLYLISPKLRAALGKLREPWFKGGGVKNPACAKHSRHLLSGAYRSLDNELVMMLFVTS